MKSATTEPDELAANRYHRAELVFALTAFVTALFLLSQMGSQVTWSSGKSLFKQPGFWPVMAIVGMVVFGAGEMVTTLRRFRFNAIGSIPVELVTWLRAVEFAAWFLIYVTMVPIAGYLLSTIGFCVLLTWRLGYQSQRYLLSAVLAGVVIVFIFKSGLSVKIPGGLIYEYLPDTMRNFMIIYF